MYSQSDMDATDFLRGCKCSGISIGTDPGRGRVLQIQRCAAAGELLVSAPLEHQVEIPFIPLSASDDDCVERRQQHIERASAVKDFEDVQVMCSFAGSAHRPDVYWAALMSLTINEVPEDRSWPCISDTTQARLLLLFRPYTLSSAFLLRSGRCSLEDDKPGTDLFHSQDLPSETERETMRTQIAASDNQHFLIAKSLCQHFALRASPCKVLDLVLVWMYNSFKADCPTEAASMTGSSLQIFICPALCSHSCQPNCTWSYGDDGRFNIYVGQQSLATGEELTISYLSESSLNDFHTLQRRETLAWSWLFLCECIRCSPLTVPVCKDCSPLKLASTVFSWEERQVRSNPNAKCRSCDSEELESMHGYFFRCQDCLLEICPPCALESMAASQVSVGSASAQCGLWKHRDRPEESEEIIVGDTLVWSNGGTSKVSLTGESSLSIRVNGCLYEADIVGQTLVWDDGDVWIPALH